MNTGEAIVGLVERMTNEYGVNIIPKLSVSTSAITALVTKETTMKLCLKDLKNYHVFDLKPGSYELDLEGTRDPIIIRRDPSSARAKKTVKVTDVACYVVVIGGKCVYRVSFDYPSKMSIDGFGVIIGGVAWSEKIIPAKNQEFEATIFENDVFVKNSIEMYESNLEDVCFEKKTTARGSIKATNCTFRNGK